MKVYRVENSRGEGPYNGLSCACRLKSCKHSFLIREMKADHAFNYRTPSPLSEGPAFKRVLDSNDNYLFGFISRELALRWFDGWLAQLEECGFTLKEMEAKVIVEAPSGLQCVFLR